MKHPTSMGSGLRLAICVALLVAVAALQPVFAGDMWFSTTTKPAAKETTAPTGERTFFGGPVNRATTPTLVDVVISLHTQPTGDNDVTTADDRTPYEQIIQYFADGVYEMSNGAHKLRNVRIYTNGFYADKCDVTWTASGWPCANTCGRGTAGQHVYMFTDFSGTNFLTNQELGGYCLAHEWGHFFYGLFDEYKSGNTANDAFLNQPHSTDNNTNQAIMNNQWKGATDKDYLNFSTDTRSDYDTVNAQFRVYKASCWATAKRPATDDPRDGARSSLPVRPYYSDLAAVAPVAQASASVPSSIELPATAARSDLKIIWMESNLVYQIVIDRSGSMSGSMDQVIEAAKLLVDVAPLPAKTGDPAVAKIGVVDFDDYVTQTIAIRDILTQADKTAIKSAIDSLYDRNNTAIFDAALTALSGFSGVATNEGKAVFLLSDGYENASSADYDDVVSAYAAAQVPIFSFGYGSTVDPRLSSMASDTGGKYYSSPRTLTEITGVFQDANQQASQTTGVATGSTSLPASQTTSYDILVDSSLKQLDVIVTFVGAPADATVVLKDPTGATVASDTPTQSAGETLVHYAVATPAAGTWKLEATPASGSIDFSYRATATPADQATYTVGLASLTGATVTYPAPIVLLATLEKGLPISGAVVSASVKAPDGTVTAVMLKDDGVAPDAIANDGRYSAIFDYSQNGTYEVEVSMNNTSGTAKFTYAGTQTALDVNGNSANVPPAPVPDDFMRFARLQIKTTGVASDDHGDTPDSATAIQANNSDHIGKMDKTGDKDVFSFTNPAGLTIIRVTDFALGMVPKLRILASDKATVLAQGNLTDSATSNGYVALSVSANAGDTLYAEVSHTDSTAVGGTYSLSAGTSIPGDFAVKFTTPGDSRVIVNAATISIAGVASANCTGVAWSSDRGGSGSCTGTTNWSAANVSLKPGANIITVTATATTMETATANLTVIYWVGLGMVSVPIVPNTADPAAAINFTSWLRYDPAQTAYMTYGSAADNTAHFTWFDAAASVPGRGYWAYFTGNTPTLPTGTAPSQTTSVTIPLKAGWNMIGCPFLTPLQWSVTNIQVQHSTDGTKSLADAATAGWTVNYAWGWEQDSADPSTGEYALVYDLSQASGVEGFLRPWQGYWFRALVDCNLILPPP